MGLMTKILIKTVLNIAAMYTAAHYVNGVYFSGGLKEYVIFGAVAMMVNLIIRPLIQFITKPIIWVTFGLFTIVINMAIMYGLDYFFANLKIDGLMPLFWTSIIFAVANIY